MPSRASWLVCAIGTVVLGLASPTIRPAHATESGQPAEDPWPTLASLFFGNEPLREGDGVLALEAPYRALDAAVVPITIRLPPRPGDDRAVRRVSLVIDGNPSPLAATFTLGGHGGVDAIATRVRVDDYTNIHAVAELSDGTRYVVSRFVKAAGGCSAPALKQTASAIPLGTMRWREFVPADKDGAAPGEREAQLMIRHPNYSGMQMDQVTRLYIPAEFIRTVEIRQGSDVILAVEGGIALSENPEFRFRFRPSGDAPFHAEAVDSTDKRFGGEWKADTSS